VLFGASTAMFLISVVHLGLVMRQVSVDVNPLSNFQAQVVLATTQFVIGDLVLIWRVWTIWGRNYWIAAGPLAIMVVAAGFSLKLATMTATPSFFKVAPVALIVANTSICTLLIAGRIWYLHHQSRRYAGRTAIVPTSRRYKGAIFLIIETGALYVVAQFSTLILNDIQSPGLSVMQNLEIPLIGILPTLIIVLVYFGVATNPDTAKTSMQILRLRDKLHLTDNMSSKTPPVGVRSSTNRSTFEEQDFEAHTGAGPLYAV